MDATPEDIQWIMGIHPQQLQAAQAFGRAAQGQGFSGNGPAEPEQPKEEDKPLISRPSSSPRGIDMPPVTVKQPAPTEPEAQPPSISAPGGTKSLGGLMSSPAAAISQEEKDQEDLREQERKDRAELERKRATGSGVEQFQHRHHILGPIVRGLSIAGQVVAPGVAAAIPGTDLHHQVLLNQDTGRVERDIKDETAHQGMMDKEELERSREETAAAREETNRIRRQGMEEKFVAGSEQQDANSPTGWTAETFKGERKPYTPLAGTKNTKADDLSQEIDARWKEGEKLGLTGDKLREYALYGKREPATHIHVPSAESEHYADVKAAFNRQYGHDPTTREEFDIFNAMLKGERGGAKAQHTFRDSAAVDKYSNDWYAKQRKDVLADKAKVHSLNPDADEAQLQKEYNRIEGEYAQKAAQFETQKKQWYAQVNGGQPVNVTEDESGMPQSEQAAPAPASQPGHGVPPPAKTPSPYVKYAIGQGNHRIGYNQTTQRWEDVQTGQPVK